MNINYFTFDDPTNVSTGNVGLISSDYTNFDRDDDPQSLALQSNEYQIQQPVLVPSMNQLNGPRSRPDGEDEQSQKPYVNRQEGNAGSRNQQNQSNQEDQPNQQVINSIGGAGIAPSTDEQKNNAAANESRVSLLGITKCETGNWLELTSLAKDVSKKAKQEMKRRELFAEMSSVKKVWLKIKTLHYQNRDFIDDVQGVFDYFNNGLDSIKLDFTGFEDNDFFWRRINPRLKDLLNIAFSPPSLNIKALEVIWNFRHSTFCLENAADCLIQLVSERLPSLTLLTDFKFEFRYLLGLGFFKDFLKGLRSVERNLTKFELEVQLSNFDSIDHLMMPEVKQCILKFSYWGNLDSNASLITFIADSLKHMIKIKELEIEIITEDLEVEALKQIFAVVNNKRETLTSLKIMISCAAIEENNLALQLKKLVKCAAEEIKDSRLRELKIGVDKMICEEKKGKKEIQEFFRKIRESTN